MTLSIDNVVLDVKLTNPPDRNQLMRLMDSLPLRYSTEVVHWNKSKPGTFKEQFAVRLPGEVSFWLGVALNGVSTDWGRCRLDFNPNKVATSEVFWVVWRFLMQRSRPLHRQIRRFDLAIDLPVERYRCFLIKDKRMYIERRHGQEYTQYLGAKSSTVGRVKLYNKQAESDLSYPLTRLELTLNPAVPFEDVVFPTVYYLDSEESCLDGLRITDTEKFILGAIMQGYGSLNDLGKKTRKKIVLLMENCLQSVVVEPEDYKTILGQLQQYVADPAQTSLDPKTV